MSEKVGMMEVTVWPTDRCVYAQGGFLNSGETAASHGYSNVIPYAGRPESPDRDSLNFSYLEKLDEVVRYMQSHGMVADLILTNFYPNGRMAGTDAQNDRFIKYVINRYAAHDNVIWCLANEWAAGSSAYDGKLIVDRPVSGTRFASIMSKALGSPLTGAAAVSRMRLVRQIMHHTIDRTAHPPGGGCCT